MSNTLLTESNPPESPGPSTAYSGDSHSGGGVSIAPRVSATSGKSIAPRPIEYATFRPRLGMVVGPLVAIALTVWLTMMLSLQPVGILLVTTGMCVIVGVVQVIYTVLRWENAEAAYERERTAAELWNLRFENLQSEFQRTTSALSHMTDGVVMLSPKTEIVLINEAARRLLALSSGGQYLGRKISEIVRIPDIVSAVDRAGSGKIDENVAVEVVDGSVVRPVAVRVSRILETEPPHLLLILSDETEAHRVEAIRREFIANVSHELKTPLAAIKGYAETVELAIQDDPESAAHFIAQIGKQCDRLEALIADMMKLARAQSGKGTLVIQALDLEKVINQAMSSFLPVAGAKQIDLSVVPSDQPVHVLADEEAALTIAQNLISNAIRHTNAGGHVVVSFRKDGDGWVMAVQDDGVGIAEEYQERIFERFYRVDRTRKAHDGGTGIGLSIVKNLSRALGGRIGVISSPGNGATFEVWLRSAISK
ncbi:ATP-binding protein [Roseiconus lacunae]|uniref:sensor histidine kinase n=1 Tax=Roseiconus lacunae TaxID=2605694 RepID=UPI0030934554|nr:ATP-binding protein [Stieleria sp. HD01]